MYFFIRLAALVLSLNPLVALADSGRLITVDFSTAQLTVTEGATVVFETPVVLPRGNYYPVPLRGTVRRAVMGPTWTPTANMHRDFPGRYRQSYGPYEAGNAMGHCKIYIDFDQARSYPILNTVRIHGNAKAEDLRQRRSRSCIRIPDALCQALVSATNDTNAPVTVAFVR